MQDYFCLCDCFFLYHCPRPCIASGECLLFVLRSVWDVLNVREAMMPRISPWCHPCHLLYSHSLCMCLCVWLHVLAHSQFVQHDGILQQPGKNTIIELSPSHLCSQELYNLLMTDYPGDKEGWGHRYAQLSPVEANHNGYIIQQYMCGDLFASV